jgi:NAD(P)-dependent dehydrogenase (short-subunit alcohol dehydrogenase family)
MARFDGRLVVVTGGTGALGTAVVERLLSEGAAVAVPEVGGHEPEGWLDEGAGRVFVRTGIDLSDADATSGFYDAAAEWGGPLWASVHVAGGFAMGAIDEADAGTLSRMLTMNTLTCGLCCREAVRHMKASGAGGRIVNVAARPALDPEQGKGMTAYAASKAAVAALTVALGAEVADDGILVNAVAPSIIDTPANRAAMPDANHDEWPTPADLAEVMCFLACPENRVTRSSVVRVYGRS